jgi:hypothetical protein
MKRLDIILLILFGIIFWTAGTLWYRARGPIVFETTPLRFWINFTLAPILSAAVCLAILRWRQIPATNWSTAALLIALPGMFGEAILLTHFATWMPTMQPTSAGRYAAFLFAAYALVLTIAEAVTLRAAS